mgnify:CR=1 FL=1
MTMGIEKKSILITGCSSGIGYHAATHLHSQGWQVFAGCRKKEDVKGLKKEGLNSVLIDYSDETSIEAGLNEVLETTEGRLDALFNNGAFACPGAVEDIPRSALKAIMETNLLGYHDLTTRVIPIMRKQGFGRIINCSSVLGLVTLPWRGAYNASKFALEGLTHTLRIEMRDTPIEVILIEPGPITTKIRENSLQYFETWIDWQSSARAKEYEIKLNKHLYSSYKKSLFELPPSAVTDKLMKALEERKPRACYFVTTPTYVMSIMKRILPIRALDWILSKC